MGRPKKSVPAPIEPEEESQEIPEEEPEVEQEVDEPEPAPAPTVTMTKADVCRALLAEGVTENEDAVAAARSRFGIEIKPTDFSLYKSKEKAKQGAPKGTPGRKHREESAEPTTSPARPVTSETTGNHEMVDDLIAVKHLVQKLGAEQVRKIVGLFE